MREIIYFSENARTSGNFNDLMKAGRMDIVCHVIIMAFFLSNKMRNNIRLHLFFNGPPDPPKHLELMPKVDKDFQISKKDISGLIKRMLYKYKKGKKVEAFPGCYIEKLRLIDFINKLNNKNIYILDKNGEDIRNIKIRENPVFILGDHEGITKKDLREISKIAKKISLGNETYFASQSLVILNNELDRRNV